ncbi:MAG TPA: OmpA family protein [Bacteroidia bacterium]|nr:OmpA family protein [Bacteroidia bacterium]
MKLRNIIGLVLGVLLFSSSFVGAQDLKKKYDEAEIRMNNSQYDQALPLFLTIDSALHGSNNSIKFQIGECYLNSPIHQGMAIPYLQTASKDISEKYNPVNLKETHAPADAFLYLAKAYHLSYKFDTAISYYNKFKSMLDSVNDKETVKEVNRDIQMCNTGKQLMASPVKMEVSILSDSINSSFPDYSPVVTADESQIFFTSRRPINPQSPKDFTGQYFENIYMANNMGGQWHLAYNIGTPVTNSGQHSATVSISPDGQTIFIYRDDEGDGNIYITHLNGTIWSTPEKLNDNVDSKYWEPSASVSADGQTLYFTSNRPGGFGGRDIYMSRQLPNGQWAKAVNLGPKINTEFEEDAPFISASGKTLYFSSTGHNTMGGFDIFYSELNDSNGQWGTPVNMGYPVNTPGDDIFFVPTADGKGAYYSSFKETGQGEKDIYRINFPEKKAEALTVYRGTIISSLDSAHPNIPQNVEIVVTDNATGEQVGVYHPNSATGKFLFILPSGKNYNITYQAEGYMFHSENLDVRDSTAYEVIDQAIDMHPLGIGEKIVLRNIFFPLNKATISPESAPELHKVYDLMKMLPGITVEISGHTDASGSDKINTPLSQARAEAVVDYLVNLGIDRSRFVAKGYGPTQPVAKNKNPDGSWNLKGMALNRRIEFKIISSSIPIKVERPSFVPDNLKPQGQENKNK